MRAGPARISVAKYLQAILLLAVMGVPAAASPWAEAGDPQLRSDIELLANAGVRQWSKFPIERAAATYR